MWHSQVSPTQFELRHDLTSPTTMTTTMAMATTMTTTTMTIAMATTMTTTTMATTTTMTMKTIEKHL